MTNAVFSDTRQALHVSFLILSTDPRAKNAFRTALIRILEMQPRLTDRQQTWLDQLIGDASESTVNFGGLSGDDVRAQCAAVVSAVTSKLPELEQWALFARFGQMGDELMPTGVKRFYFLRERSEAIQGLSRWLAPSFDGVSVMALDCLLARLYVNHSKIDISFRDIAQSFGASHMTYKRTFDKLKVRINELENRAVDMLTPYFERTGLVDRITEETA
jgi:hypothetical protein